MPAKKDDVLNVLRDPRTALIDFHLEHFHVSGTGYELVAAAIEDGRITVEVGDSTKWAYYDYWENTLFTRREQMFRDADRALVIHECTHALVDLQNFWKFTDLSNESAAYLAQVVFRYLCRPDMSIPRDGSTPYKQMFRYACILVEKYKLHLPEGRGTRLKWDEYRTLRRLVQWIPEYRHVGWLEDGSADGV